MRPRHLALASALIVIVAACSGTGTTAAPTAASSPSAAAPSPSPGSVRLEVELNDSFMIEPSSMTVPAGVPVTFVVTNSGAIEHEFYLGDEAAQAEHDEEMLAGGMRHDEPEGIGLDPGETKELTFTFAAPGNSLAGCHVPGHYAAGMKASITVTE